MILKATIRGTISENIYIYIYTKFDFNKNKKSRIYFVVDRN